MLAIVRRYEAAGFRAWPAAAVHYDGTWLVRLTAGHPAKRLNSVNPLDPGDTHAIAERIVRASRRFEAYGRPLTFRMSPLSGQVLSTHLDDAGWSRFDESVVMRLPLKEAQLDAAMDQIPLKDISRFIGAAIRTNGSDEAGLFALEDGNEPLATLICVHDGDLAGVFEVATEKSARKKGHGRNLILSALKWARLRGAREAWLQVEAGNVAALSLYRSLGFEEVYRYHYRRRPDA
ncbi:MAG: GNAT family N-acetyltransferase [Mesorhizobium sp.]|nr:MAG: GNAT family N-acetyltransferase [Mesorhizobium sp.]